MIRALVPLLLLTACHGKVEDPKVERAWVRLPAVHGQPAAAYFTVIGGGGDAAGDRLVKIESALAKRTEMHESMAGSSGTMAMAPITSVTVPAHARVEFKPNGRHAMLIDLDAMITPGTAVPLRFGFASGKTAEAEAKTVAAGEDAPY